MNEDVVKALYVREVTMAFYGEPEPFGTYDNETKKLTITNARAMGTLTKERIQEYCDAEQKAGSCASHILFGVPLKAWELREQSRYRDMRND